MTMSSSVSKVILNGDGVQTAFPFSFKVWKAADLEVTITDSAGDDTVTTNWTVELAGNGGTVTYPATGSPLPSGYKITIRRDMDFLQMVDLISGARWDAEVVETALDMATAERQQLREELGRALKLPVSESSTDNILQQILDAVADAEAAAAEATAAVAAAEQAAGQIGTLSAIGIIEAGDDTITLPWSYDTTAGNVTVFLSGVKQAADTLTFPTDTTIQLGAAVTEDTVYEVLSLVINAESVLTDIVEDAEAAKDAAVAAQAAAEAAQDAAEDAAAGTIDVPIGALIYVTGTVVPIGYVKANGQILSRAMYPGFWAWVQASGNVEASDAAWQSNLTANGGVNGRYSPGDGSTTFRVPSLGGSFIRSWQSDQTMDTGRAVGSYQADELKSHRHELKIFRNNTNSGGYAEDANNSGTQYTNYSEYEGGDETRPKNTALMACIKAYTSVNYESVIHVEDIVTLNGTQTLTNKTYKGGAESVYILSGTTPALDPDNGTIQTWTLTGISSPTDSFTTGQSMTLMVNDGTAYTINWPAITWVGGSAPTLATSGYSVIVLWKVGATLYGKHAGDA